MWGNKCDLSISLGRVDGSGQLHDTEDFEPFVLADDSERIYQVLVDCALNNDDTIGKLITTIMYKKEIKQNFFEGLFEL